MKPDHPHFLIAMPQLLDPHFERGVVFMISHNLEGAIGFLVNKPLSVNLGQFAASKNVPCHPNIAEIPVYSGGPVERDHGWILHKDASVAEKREILPGVYLSATLTTLYDLLKKGQSPLRLILGYAGWSSQQLEGEMQTGSWLNSEPFEEILFTPNVNDAWRAALKKMGIEPAQLSSVSGVH